ncbi:MAG: 16S rRNA (guanine(966)-N(2))-methyltransferase RsmD [Bacillota bacterium]|nr:16S rRNA (guanine(966)-N(2))-methyltransferase RsmD [Bacillota bacterium]NLJ02369.1 16S rRNA (guanine(966)-N(2))-methyltransferase RsmD [Bacillota bacterium]
MRIIAGKAKGTRLSSVSGLTTRPTGDRVKEALFNILGPAVTGSAFLDLYAGSGAIGLEALSRGASDVVWIDASRACTAQIRANLEKARLSGGTVYTNDVFRALVQLEKAGRRFDFIFLDPPYGQGLVGKTLEHPSLADVLKKEGIIIAEAGKKEEAPIAVSKLCLKREQRYGDTKLLFYDMRGS